MSPLIYVLLGILCLVFFLWKTKRYHGKEIPGPKGLPIIGCLFEIRAKALHDIMSNYAREFGDIVKIRICGLDLVVLNSYELIDKAFRDGNYKAYINEKPKTYVRTFLVGV